MLLDDVVAGFDACITAAPELRRSVIHGDANETNLLVDAADGRAARVTGLLDFGDCTHSILACEVAIATVYMLLLVESKLGVDTSWRAAGALLAGYDQRALQLLPAERAALRTLCCGSLAQSLALGLCSAAAMPENAAYLLDTQQGGWLLLRRLWGMTDDAFSRALQPIK